VKPVNLLLGPLDEKFEWEASKKLVESTETEEAYPLRHFKLTFYFASCTDARFAGGIGIHCMLYIVRRA
jgi:hypothetical protein